MPILMVGATGSGKTTALIKRYHAWVQAGARTDQVLVLTAGSAHAARWRREVSLESHGPLEVYSFFGFIQRELTLFWAPLQATMPPLQRWVRPEFLNVEIAHHLMYGLVEPLETEFSAVLKARPARIAIQIASNLSTVAAAAGLSPGAMAERLAASGRQEKAHIYATVQGLLESFRESCLEAGILDYGLSLHLFTHVLMQHPDYLAHLSARYRYLLVDDLDESVPAEQDFLAALVGRMTETEFAFSTDGGHSGFMGADPQGAIARSGADARRIELSGSHTCTSEAFEFAEALAQRIMGRRQAVRFSHIVEEHIATDLRGDMIERVVRKALELVQRGIPPGEVALLIPHVEKALEVTARRVLGERSIAVKNVSLSHRLIDEPYARAIVTLAGLVHPQWHIPQETAGFITNAMHLLLKLDPIRASVLGDEIWRSGRLPNLDETELRRRIGFERAEAYDFLRNWVEEAKRLEWETDAFVQAVVAQVMAPLVGDLTPEKLYACQQLLVSAHRFRMAMERFGEGAYGSEYIKMLTEGTVAAEPLEAYSAEGNAVLLATPFAYLTSRSTSRYQIWIDISSTAWYPNDVKELANPHVLSRKWEGGERWTDTRNSRIRQANAARTARALLRRCRGRLVLAECSLTAWGMEQEGGLSEAFADLVRERGRVT